LASANYKANDEERPVLDAPRLAPLAMLDMSAPQGWNKRPQQNAPTLSPPEFLAGWQFFLRAAPSPRAPSFAS
jgi:hypothetical protein